jgi:aminopeptidase N
MSMGDFRYRRSDFGDLPVKLEHMDVHLNFLDGRVAGVNVLRLTALTRLRTLQLDARDLTIQSIALVGQPDQELPYEWRSDGGGITVKFPAELPAGHTFSIRAKAVSVPSDSVLEGIYKDTTPPGCPQQYMSQCQQWGFQRILPVIDDCRAKCTMTTTVEADARYTHLLSNGNVSRVHNPDGVPVLKAGEPDRKTVTYVNDIPMAPYLFLCCVGTWDVQEDYVAYQSGRKVKLEYLVPPGRKEGAVVPMRILKESVLWMAQTQDYEYPREVYRTICMEKSNYGGMENVGNTTIITSAALVDEFTTDRRLQYAHGVILHEFEHNQCGSDVTMETPFDMWLNEAFTVDVERQFLRGQFEPVWQRLDEVDAIRAPMTGPLAIEDAGHLGNIVRDGFNSPDELVDGVTYVKAAEVIRMLRLIIGADAFRKGKNLYFQRYDGSNANTEQFFACFEEVSGRDLSGFRREWLHTIGYPKVEGTSAYDERSRMLTLTLRQTRAGKGGAFHLPVEVAAVDGAGKDIPGTHRVIELVGETIDIQFKDIPQPEFVSWNRDASFYGTFRDAGESVAGLARQIRKDPNLFNRVEAMRRLTDIERVRLIMEPDASVSTEWLEIYGAILRDKELPPGLKSFLLQIEEQSLQREYLTFYRERCHARQSLLRQAAARHMGDLIRVFRATDTYRRSVIAKDGMAERRLKSVVLRVIVEANTANTHAVAEEHFNKAWNITDKLSTLGCIHVSEHPRRRDLMLDGFAMWKDHHAAYTSYLLLVGSGTHDDVFEMLAAEENRPQFNLQHPGHTRALYVPMALNNKMVWTDAGIRWVVDTVRKLTPVNEYCTLQVLACFQQVHNLANDLRPKVIEALREMDQATDATAFPSVSGRIRAYLQGTGASPA